MNSYSRQTIYNTSGNIIYMFCIWIITVLIVRITGYEDAGVFSIAMSIANIFFIITMFGMRSYQVSDVDKEFSSACYVTSRLWTIFFGVVISIIYLLIANLTKNISITIILFFVYRISESMSDVYFGELQKHNRLDISCYSMSGKGILSVLIFALIYNNTHNLQLALASICLVALIITVFFDRTFYRRIGGSELVNFTPRTLIDLISRCLPILPAVLFSVIFTAVPRLAIQRQLGVFYAGIFSSVSTPTVIITTLVPNILIPFITLYASYYKQKLYDKIWKMYSVSLICVILICSFMCFCAYFLGKPIMAFVFGKGILNYIYLLLPFIIASSLYALTMCGNAVLITIRKTWPVFIYSFLSFLVCAIVIFPLVKRIGLLGATIAMIIAYTFHFVLQIINIAFFLRKNRENNIDMSEKTNLVQIDGHRESL